MIRAALSDSAIPSRLDFLTIGPLNLAIYSFSEVTRSSVSIRRDIAHVRGHAPACAACECPTSDSPPLGGPAPVVRNRGHIFDRGDFQPGRLQRSDRRFTSHTRTLHEDLDLPKPECNRIPR